MSKELNLKYQAAAAWSGFLLLLLYGICWGGLGHGAPPISPNLGAAGVAAFEAQHHFSILLGMTGATVVAGLWIPWTAQLTLIMLHTEGTAPILTIIQAIGGILTAWILISCPPIWAVAAFRPDLDPSTIRMLSDLGFIIFNLTFIPTTLQAVAVGLLGLADKSQAPVFPRWVCYVAIACGLANFPVMLVPFFTTGALAWDGWFNFYFPGLAFYVWGFTMSIYMVKDAHRRLRVESGAIAARPVAMTA